MSEPMRFGFGSDSPSGVEPDIRLRLYNLENTVRRQRIALAGAVLVAALVMVFGFTIDPVQDVVRTRRLEVVGPSGSVAAYILADDNRGSIELLDTARNTTVLLRADVNGGMFDLYNSEGWRWLWMEYLAPEWPGDSARPYMALIRGGDEIVTELP